MTAEAVAPPVESNRLTSFLMVVLALWAALIIVIMAIGALNESDPVARAVYRMSVVHALLWIVLGGGLMWRFRDGVRAWVLRQRGGWRVKFVVLCVVLALLEEASTTLMTNLAPVFGAPFGSAYITASADYLEVVLFHSVVVFVPMFVAWAWLLARYAFSPARVLILFGLTGLLAEAISFGAQLPTLGFWVFIYGLMVYLPAYSVPHERGARTPNLLHYALAVVLPVMAAVPVVLIVGALHPVSIHFAP
jgi:hypothetical protein